MLLGWGAMRERVNLLVEGTVPIALLAVEPMVVKEGLLSTTTLGKFWKDHISTAQIKSMNSINTTIPCVNKTFLSQLTTMIHL